MLNFKNAIRLHKKVVIAIAAVFCCSIAGIIFTISRPVQNNQLNQSSSSLAPASSSVKVKIADILPASSTASGAASSKAPALKVGLGKTVSEGEANYKPAKGQPQTQTSGSDSQANNISSTNTEVSIK